MALDTFTERPCIFSLRISAGEISYNPGLADTPSFPQVENWMVGAERWPVRSAGVGAWRIRAQAQVESVGKGALGEELLAHPPGISNHLPLAPGIEGTQWELGEVRAGQSQVLPGKSPLAGGRRTGALAIIGYAEQEGKHGGLVSSQ